MTKAEPNGDTYRAEITQIGRWWYLVQIRTIGPPIRLPGGAVHPGVASVLATPPPSLGRRCAERTAPRMRAAFRRRDTRRPHPIVRP